jgi:hypothetical protein
MKGGMGALGLSLYVLAQVANPYRPELRDEGTAQGRVGALNCTGAGISCSVTAGVGTINVAGGGGSGNLVEASIDFGATGDTTASVVITGQSWVSTSSVIVCSPTMLATADRADGAEDAVIEGLTVAAHSRIAGTGFTVTAAPYQGRAYGAFKVHCAGA